MRHHLRILTAAVVLACGCGRAPDEPGKPPAGAGKPPPSGQEKFAEIDSKVMQAWEKAGASYGLTQRTTFGTPSFEWINRIKGDRIGLPTFVLGGTPEDLTGLPEPEVPFGINVIQSPNKVNNGRFAQFPKLKNLRVLLISLAWADPEGWEHIGAIPGLRALAIQSASGLDKAMLARITRHKGLEELYVAQKPRLGNDDLELIAGMSKLHTLYLQDHEFGDAGVKHLAGMKNIRNLGLHGWHVTDEGLKPLAGLPLDTLSLDGMKQLSDTALQTVAVQFDLRRLSLVGCHKVTDGGVKHLSGMKNLQELNLSGTGVTGAGLAPLASLGRLRRLNVRDQKMTDEAVGNLKRIGALQWLSARVSKEQAAGLRAAIPGLQIEGVKR